MTITPGHQYNTCMSLIPPIRTLIGECAWICVYRDVSLTSQIRAEVFIFIFFYFFLVPGQKCCKGISQGSSQLSAQSCYPDE